MRTLVHLFVLAALGCSIADDQVSEPDVTICEGREAVFTCVLNSSIRSDDVQWYRFIKDTSAIEMVVNSNKDNINIITDTIGSTTSSSLTITNVIKSYTGYFWVGTPSHNICNASLTVLTSPSALSLNVIKNSKLLSVDIQWDAVDDSLTTNYTIQWTRAGDDIQAATLIEQTSYMINGLTLDTVYAISVFAVNRCGTGPGSIASVSFPTVINEPDDVTVCEGREAVFTCVLNSNIRSDDVQWYRFIKDTSTTEMVDPNGDNIYFITDTIGNPTSSSLTITNVIKSYTGYFWVGTPSLTVCNASLTVLTSPSVLTVNIAKNIENSSIVVQWDIVDDSLITTYTITWSRVGGGLQTATLAEKASRTITGLTLNTVYIITVGAANMCGSGPEFSTTILLSVATTSATSSISPTVPVSTSSTDSMSISNANPSSTIVITTTNPMTISTTASTPTISVINPSITTTDSVITTESKNITTISNIETTTTTVNITKQFTSAVSFSTSPNIVDENSDSGNIPIIAGAAIGGIIVVTIIIVLIIFIFICYFQQKKDTEKNNYNDLPGDDTLTKNIPVALNPLNANDKSIAESSHQMVTTVEGLYMTSDIGNKKPPPSYKPLQSTPQNGRIDTQHQQSVEYAVIDDVKKTDDKQQNGERDIHHQPMEYAVVDKSKKDNRKEDKQQNVGTDTKHQQPMEYAVVDTSKKKSRKGDIQQDVEDDDGTIPRIDEHTYANQNKINPLLHYADLGVLPPATGAYVAADDSRTPYALVAET